MKSNVYLYIGGVHHANNRGNERLLAKRYATCIGVVLLPRYRHKLDHPGNRVKFDGLRPDIKIGDECAVHLVDDLNPHPKYNCEIIMIDNSDVALKIIGIHKYLLSRVPCYGFPVFYGEVALF